MNNSNNPQPDFSNVSRLVPEIEFLAWEDDSREWVGDAVDGFGPVGEPPVQAKAAYEVLRSADKAEQYLSKLLAGWYPAKAASLDDLVAAVRKVAKPITGTQSYAQKATESDYMQMQKAYGELRGFMSALEGLETEDSYNEETHEQ